ncbi:uncharacterized protein DDB_G0283357 isoform X2 [Episyrphus balteatus]|uniref:uncharacterized protein DDB_G0283357 isoform X2 n=1 Tax=Episyrphus balteatus TaxID=286459 RepID=UPI002485F882|nr:uncharacterized protein DDB_G0283357 isoform X2 [Episyrphus balteatus]
MWNQWPTGPPPMPPATSNPQPPIIGPVQPSVPPITSAPPPTAQVTPAPATPSVVPVAQPASYQTGAPSYTAAQYAAMTPEQQYAVQQHWQQWQAYEQQYAQWHAQYGEQYKREMAAIQSTPQAAVAAVPYNTSAVASAYNYPPPVIANPYQAPPVPVSAPPPPPPDDKTNKRGINAPAQIYEQPPPPPPPPQQEGSQETKNDAPIPAQSPLSSQPMQNEESRWSQPPPLMGPNAGSRWNEPNEEQQSNQQNRQNNNQNNRQQQNQQFRQQNQLNQQDRQQKNQFNQQDRQQQNQFNQFNQQDRQQQNQFNQQFNNNNQQGRQNQNNQSRGIQRDDQGRNNWQGNRQNNNNNNNNNFRGRNRGRNDSDGRGNYQQQSWQEMDNSAERNNRRNNSNRFDNSFDNSNNTSMGQGMNQQGWGNNNQGGNFGTPENMRHQPNMQHMNQEGLNNSNQQGWGNNNQGGNFGTPENVRQQQHAQNQSTPNENTNKGTSGKSVDEKAFDEQFRMWEEQFENWKKENANHPDRTMYMKYEREFEKTRVRLLERREQMRRRKMMEMQQQTSNSQVETPELPAHQQHSNQPNLIQQDQQIVPPKLPQQQSIHAESTSHFQQKDPSKDSAKADGEEIETQEVIETPKAINCEGSDMEQSDPEDRDVISSTKLEDSTQEPGVDNELECLDAGEASIFQKPEITDIFKSGSEGGIPGLDLVGTKDGDVVDNINAKEMTKNVIDLENDGPTRPPKLSATSTNSGMILTNPQSQSKSALKSLDSRPHSMFLSPQPQTLEPPKRKIPSLFDIVVEKPDLSPDIENKCKSPMRNLSPAGSRTSNTGSHSRSISKDRDILASPGPLRPLSQASNDQSGQQSLPNLPGQATDLAKALQDPNVMQLLSAALAQAQKTGGLNQTGGNNQQNQILQQLQQLQPLIQMQQDRNTNNQPWNNPQQQQRPQPWQNQNQNFDNRFNTNFNQNENSNNKFNANQNRNPFNKNENQMDSNRGSGSGYSSDSNRDMPQKNPRNPFRRGGGNNDKGSIEQNFESSEDQFRNTNNNAFGGQMNNPQQQRGDNFDCGPMNNPQQQRGDNFDCGQMNNPQQQRGDNFDCGRDFGGGRGNFSGRNFGARNNFDNEDNFGRGNFNEGGNNFGGGDDDNSFGGGNINNRPESNFNNTPGFRNNSNNFGDRGFGDNDYFRPAQIFDYQNRSRPEVLMPPAKVVDYGHKPSALLPATSFNRDSSEFVPVKTIDYGHASSAANPKNPFQEKNDNQTKKKTNRWNQEPTSNPVQQQRVQTQGSRGNDNGNKPSNVKNNQQKNEKKTEEQYNSNKPDNVQELDSENMPEYPKNKWILQNPENRQRPGPPTKRGKRNSNQFEPEPIQDEPQQDDFEGDEIEENFEEISDNECIIEDTSIPPINTQIKKKTVSLFPSVPDSNKTPSMVIPSNENNNTIPIDEILFKPGRLTRPKNIVIIMRGPPGSGKSHVAKLIKDKEIEMGGQTPRLLSVDDYFMVENDYEEKCPKTGRKIPKKEILYEYEKQMETTYMQYLIKSFKKTVTDHLFDFIIVDCCNQSLRTFNEFYNAARDGNFSPFVIDLKCSLETCLEQNIHNRKEEDIKEIIDNYQDCPGHYIKLDVSNLLENVVEMEDVSDLEDHFVADSEIIELDDDEGEDETSDNNDEGFLKSKWDTDPTTENLARLDGTSKPISKRGTATLEEYLQIDGWQEPPPSDSNGKKRVRWADIEEKRAQDKMRAIGFVVGQTDWNRMMDPTSGSGALTKTKYIERLNKRR